jgi:phosphatidylinositol alpha-1,6-mannosyltransferase
VTSPAAAVLRRTLRRPVVQYLYASEVAARPTLARFAARHAARCIALSRHTRDLATGIGAAASAISVIPPGVDAVEPSRRKRYERPTILTVARLNESYKGHDVMLRAMPLIQSAVPEVQWIVAGDGALRPHLEAMAQAVGISSRVRFAGELPDAACAELFERSHVFAMPSRVIGSRRASEGFGIVYLEAAQRGLPVVAGNAGGATDAVEDGVTGLLVEPTDHVAVAEAISTLLRDRDRAARMGRDAAERAKAFAWPLIARRVEDLLLEVAPRREPGR